MTKQPEEIKTGALNELEGISNTNELEVWRVRYLGKKSELTAVLRSLGSLPIEERKTVGARANEVKTSRPQLKEKLSILRYPVAPLR
jgi:phenylalanyl-tRNA synthetase alpha chain